MMPKGRGSYSSAGGRKMKRPFGVLVIAITNWAVSSLLLLMAIAVTRSPQKIEGVSATTCFLMALISAAIGVGLFRLNYWARVTQLVLTIVVLVVSVVLMLGYIAGPILDRKVHLSTIFFWLIAAGVIWYLNRPSVKKAFGIDLD
jgi:hypothetical protein